MSAPAIVVYGATGLVGGRVCAALDAADVPFVAAGRHNDALQKVATIVGAADVREASVDDPAALARAIAGAKVVVNCAGPLAELGEPILLAALASGADYIDLGGDQRFLHDSYEAHESAARKAGRVVVPGCALNCTLGDWAAAWAAAHVCGADAGETGTASVVRETAAPRLAEDNPLDEVVVSYIYDHLVLSPGSQRAVFDNLQTRGLVWRRDRWESVGSATEKRRVNVGPELGGERAAVSFPGGDVITIPRHIAARYVQTFVSTTRNAAATTALRLLARAMPLLPKRTSELLAAYKPSEDEYARTEFAIVAQARRGFSAAQIVVRGSDLYGTSAGIAAWVAQKLATRETGPVGIRAPSELFRPARALREVCEVVGLRVEPSFA